MRVTVESLEGRRLLHAGDLDTSFSGDGLATVNFGSGITATATDVAVQNDGKTVVVGNSSNHDFAIARFNVDGTLDSTFGPNHNGTILTHIGDPSLHTSASCVAIQTDGKIIVAGQADFDTPGVNGAVAVARYNTDGSLDTSFGFGGDRAINVGGDSSNATAIAIQSDGKILLGGTVFDGGTLTGGSDDFVVVRMNSHGILDGSFNGNGIKTFGDPNDDENLTALAIDYSGTSSTNPHFGAILIAGNKLTNNVSSASELELVRLKTDGSLDLSFDGDGSVLETFPGKSFLTINSAMIQSTGKIVVIGDVGQFAFPGPVDMVMGRFLSTGPIDTSFGGSGNGWRKTDLGGDYDIGHDVISSYTGGLIVAASSNSADVFLGYDANGLIDSTFGASGKVVEPFGGDIALAAGPGRRFVAAGGSAFHTARLLQAGANVVSITSLNANAFEAGSKSASFFVFRSERLSVPTRVYLNVSGTANLPTIFPATLADYFTTNVVYGGVTNGFKTYVDIPPNQTFVMVTLTPKDDAFIEPTENAIFSVKPDPTYEVGAPTSTTINIIDNDSTSLSPTADAYVQDGSSAKTNFGLTPDLQVKKGSTGFNRLTYLTFDLTTITKINTAKLLLYGNISASSSAGVAASIFGASSTSWAEKGITYSNRPAVSGSALATTTIASTTPAWYRWDITAYLKAQKAAGHKLVTLILQSPITSTPYATFSSRNAAMNQPQLLIT